VYVRFEPQIILIAARTYLSYILAKFLLCRETRRSHEKKLLHDLLYHSIMSYTVGIMYRYLSIGVILDLLNYVQLELATIS
jgi:hypothetical protein